ncbi:hypothetical protein E3E23_06765 [Thermococcus sp. CX2]|uniref:hypothetical protein n=1 Tax=Thermococcus sp. CX2 TaxID=163006 RepID=UPI001438FD87|nr:hypothetical protein [Thermococcus sp. CX2]NJE85525.1 hypothetical protein [Thermococcus sp. CX2]
MKEESKKGLSYETSFRIKVLFLVFVVGVVVLFAVIYPILSHNPNPFDVAAPKGQIVLAQNFTMGSINYTNAVPITSQNNLLVLKGNDNMGDGLTISVTSPGWCLDLWVWGGSNNGWQLKYNCSNEIQMSQYAFRRVPTHEAKEILYWYLEPGYVLVLHKTEPVQNYELVNLTVTYGGITGEGSLKVAIKKS